MTQNFIVQREVLINAPLDHVWPLVATEAGLRQWWGNRIVLEPREGGRCEEWRSDRERALHWQGVVTIYTPPHHLMMTMRAQGRPQDTLELATISIALEARGEQTRVHVTHRAFGSAAAIDEGQRAVDRACRGKDHRGRLEGRNSFHNACADDDVDRIDRRRHDRQQDACPAAALWVGGQGRAEGGQSQRQDLETGELFLQDQRREHSHENGIKIEQQRHQSRRGKPGRGQI